MNAYFRATEHLASSKGDGSDNAYWTPERIADQAIPNLLVFFWWEDAVKDAEDGEE